ncbi:MAG TPA: hypothetical protein VFL12_00425, partial [Thermoanaerobaculia bacterium]|nr:hypothetical protein [Thermoanaerobaculia bacterium]
MTPPAADRVPPEGKSRATIEWTAAAGFVAAAAIYAALIAARGALPLPRPRLSLIAAGLVVVADALRKEVFAAVAVAIGAGALLMLTASGEVTAAIVAAAILAACAEIGAGVRRAAGADAAESMVERIGLDLPLGVAAAGLSVFVLGTCRVLYGATVAAVL